MTDEERVYVKKLVNYNFHSSMFFWKVGGCWIGSVRTIFLEGIFSCRYHDLVFDASNFFIDWAYLNLSIMNSFTGTRAFLP